MKVLIVGGGGREAAFAWRLAQDCEVYCVSPHRNPSIDILCQRSGGELFLQDPKNGPAVAAFAKQSHVDLAFVSSDAPLEAGVVDDLVAAGIEVVGPTRHSAQIEWDKVFARDFLRSVRPDMSPRYWLVSNEFEREQLFRMLEMNNCEVVVKPQGLTGGKGVKVMGPHLDSFEDAAKYTQLLLDTTPGSTVVVEEKLKGVEFTFQAITDGHRVLKVPLTYDFPYRLDGDQGQGTGGMGSISLANGGFPFLPDHVHDECLRVVEHVVAALRESGRHFSGVLNTGFFWTQKGLRVMEFNARFGDPEAMNIMLLLETPLSHLLKAIAARKMEPTAVRFSNLASVVRYFVVPEYPDVARQKYEFSISEEGRDAIPNLQIFLAACEKVGPEQYVSSGSSRTMAVGVTAATIQECSRAIDAWMDSSLKGPLNHRNDIGSENYLSGLVARTRLF